MNILENIEKEQVAKLTEGKNIPNFKAGDTLKVHTKVKEGDRERIQIYEGVCIARKNDGLNSSFTVPKISFGEGVERGGTSDAFANGNNRERNNSRAWRGGS